LINISSNLKAIEHPLNRPGKNIHTETCNLLARRDRLAGRVM